jgi:hypothetical protein
VNDVDVVGSARTPAMWMKSAVTALPEVVVAVRTEYPVPARAVDTQVHTFAATVTLCVVSVWLTLNHVVSVASRLLLTQTPTRREVVVAPRPSMS